MEEHVQWGWERGKAEEREGEGALHIPYH